MGSTLYPNGVSNAAAASFEGLSDLPILDLSRFTAFWDDFLTYTAADWTVSGTNAGTPGLVDGAGGVLETNNTGALENDGTHLQKVGECFSLATDKSIWFKARLNVSEVIQSDMVVGLQITDTTPLDVTDGIFFISADGAATVDLLIEKDNTPTTLSSVATLVDATDIELAFHYDAARSRLTVYVDDVEVAHTTTLDNFPDDELLTVSFGIENGEAAAKELAVDYILAVVER
jgi:hypothetical protein